MTNQGATGKFYWTTVNPKGPAESRVELVEPDGTLAGVSLRTLQNGWGQFCDRKRETIEQRILRALNGEG